MLLEFDSYSYSSYSEKTIFKTFSKIKFTSNFHLKLFIKFFQVKYEYKKGLSDGFLRIELNLEFDESHYIENLFEAELYREVYGGLNVRAKNHI
jgi:hypothetical protein